MTTTYTPRPDAAAIGARLRQARVRAGLSQRQLVEGLDGVSYAYVSRCEAGVRRPTVRVLRLLAPRLGVSAAWLETGRDVVELELDLALLAELVQVIEQPTLAEATPRTLLLQIEAAAVAQGALVARVAPVPEPAVAA